MFSLLPVRSIPVYEDHLSESAYNMCPVQLRTQCGRNWIKPIELPAHFQLPRRKPASIFRLQLLGKVLNQIVTIVDTVFLLLLFFEDTFAHVPIHLHPKKSTLRTA